MFLGGELGITLVLKIAQGSRQIKITIHSTVLYLSSCFVYTLAFVFVLGFVVVAEGLDSFVYGCHCSGVSCVGAVNVVGSDQYNISSTACVRGLLICGPVLLLSHLFLNTYDLFFACLGDEQLVHFEESLFQCLLVLASLETLVSL